MEETIEKALESRRRRRFLNCECKSYVRCSLFAQNCRTHIVVASSTRLMAGAGEIGNTEAGMDSRGTQTQPAVVGKAGAKKGKSRTTVLLPRVRSRRHRPPPSF